MVIPTLNEENYIGPLLRSLAEQDAAWTGEVIVVDSSANSRTIEAARSAAQGLPLRILRTNVQDVAYQRNAGWRASRECRILFLDADVILPRAMFSRLNQLPSTGLFIASARHVANDSGPMVQMALWAINALILVARCARVPVTNGDFIYTSRRTLESLAGFREGFILGEDTDLGIRARKAGARSYYIWTPPITASDRRLTLVSTPRLVLIWIKAFLRALRGTPTSPDLEEYPFGLWGDRD